MLIDLQGVVPEKLGIEVADARIDLKAHDFDIDHAFEHVQARAGTVEAGVIALGPLLADLGRIARPRLPANAGKQTACLVQAQGLDQFTANGAEGRALQQHHALATQPDTAVLRRERHGLRQLFGRRQAGGAELVGAVDDQAFVAAQYLSEKRFIDGTARLARCCSSHRQYQRQKVRLAVCPPPRPGQSANRPRVTSRRANDRLPPGFFPWRHLRRAFCIRRLLCINFRTCCCQRFPSLHTKII
ncbi:hypothetical protein D3C76_922340 [compost metagenome]